MNYYEHHLGDWAKKTGHLSLIEVGAYLRLLDYCYAHETPLPFDKTDINRIAHAITTPERAAVARVMDTFFTLTDAGWINDRCEKEVARFHERVPERADKKRNTAIRQKRARLRRQAIFEALRNAGVTPAFNSPIYLLQNMLVSMGIRVPDPCDGGSDVTRDVTPAATICSQNHTPFLRDGVTSPDGDITPHAPPVPRPAPPLGRVAAAARAVKKAGVALINPSDPRFIALVESQESFEDLVVFATEAAVKGKGWAWFLATAKGRRREALAEVAADGAMPQQAPKTARQRADEATVRAWVPQLAAKPLEGV